jgi:3-dehydroquinate synthase
MIAEARLSEKMGVADEPVAEPISRAFKGLGLARKDQLSIKGHSPATVLDLLRHDKKFRSGAFKFVLPQHIGAVRIVDNVPEQPVREVLDELVADMRN